MFGATVTESRAEEPGLSFQPGVISESKKVAQSKEFITTESGLKYRDVKLGTGDPVTAGHTVRIHYIVWLDDFDGEKKFDSSYDRDAPKVLKVGQKEALSGNIQVLC